MMWEYDIMTIVPHDGVSAGVVKNLLNKKGEKRWELVTVVDNIFYFKRRINSIGPKWAKTTGSTVTGPHLRSDIE